MGTTACDPRYYYENHGPPPVPATPSGNYTIIVTAQFSNGVTAITTPPNWIDCQVAGPYGMNRWYPLPTECTRWWRERLRRCSWSAHASSAEPPAEAHPETFSGFSSIPSRVCLASHPAQTTDIIRGNRGAVAAGRLTPPATLRTSAASFLNRQPRCAPSSRDSRWPGLVSTNIHDFSTIVPALSRRRPAGSWPRAIQSASSKPEARTRLEVQPSASPKSSTPNASPRFTSGFAPATSISSTSRLPCRVRTQAVRPRSIARLRSRQPVAYGAFLHTQPDHRILSFSPELFFRLEAKAARAASSPAHEGNSAPRPHHPRRPRPAEWLRNDPKNRAKT